MVKKIVLLGTDFSNANYGCRALGYAAIKIIQSICEAHNDDLEVTAVVYDDSIRPNFENLHVKVDYIKIQPKKASFYAAYKKALKCADFAIDFTGGDSFSDIYGVKNFVVASILKEIAISCKIPFVLGPQTIGPFQRKWIGIWAKHIIKKSAVVFTRDEKSFEYCRQLSGITPILTTDVAFELPYESRERNDNGRIKVGINPSGLLWFKNKTFEGSSHLCVDYKAYVNMLFEKLHANDNYEVHLIPHVFLENYSEYDENCSLEDDRQACLHIQKKYPDFILEKDITDPMKAKSIISTMDVFSGARMHATIAAFSAGVPVIPFSYSRKFEGLFGSLDYNYIINGTSMDTEIAVQKTLEWIEAADKLKQDIDVARIKIENKMLVLKRELTKIMY